jgi:hypothetical protein
MKGSDKGTKHLYLVLLLKAGNKFTAMYLQIGYSLRLSKELITFLRSKRKILSFFPLVLKQTE